MRSRRWHLMKTDWRMLVVIFSLMLVSLSVISATTAGQNLFEAMDEGFFTPTTQRQLQRFALGWIAFFCAAAFDYNKLREWTWFLYFGMILSLIGVFFVDPTVRVHRWYHIPFTNIEVQPSEYAKLIVVIALSWFLERRRQSSRQWSTACLALLFVGVPFLLILKQPDLGTSLVLFPIALVMFYFGSIHPWVIRGMLLTGIAGFVLILLIFTGVLSYEEVRPYATVFLKEYQYERLNPDTHHQWASTTAIALGGLTGMGWRQGSFTAGGWLPYPHTDSVFPAWGEAFGFVGLILLLFLFYALIYCCFRVVVVAKDPFGRLLAAGVGVYLAMHILVNVGMMCGFLPITGVPLLLVTYGGSSTVSTMVALGLVQSVYSRRFMF